MNDPPQPFLLPGHTTFLSQREEGQLPGFPAPLSASCLFIRLLVPLLPQHQGTLTDLMTWKSDTADCWALKYHKCDFAFSLGGCCLLFSSSEQPTDEFTTASSSITHHPFRAWENRRPVHHGIPTHDWYVDLWGILKCCLLIWVKYVNHTSSVLLISNVITPHLSLYVRKTAILSKVFSFFPLHRQCGIQTMQYFIPLCAM